MSVYNVHFIQILVIKSIKGTVNWCHLYNRTSTRAPTDFFTYLILSLFQTNFESNISFGFLFQNILSQLVIQLHRHMSGDKPPKIHFFTLFRRNSHQ